MSARRLALPFMLFIGGCTAPLILAESPAEPAPAIFAEAAVVDPSDDGSSITLGGDKADADTIQRDAGFLDGSESLDASDSGN